MKKLLILVLALTGCGTIIVDKRSHNPNPDNWKVIDRAVINAKADVGLYATENTTITYTSAIANQFTINTGNIITVESGDGETLDLGTIDATQLKVNDLYQCGVGNDEKCTSAIIRIYTTEVTGHSGVAGFVNKDDSYGVDILAGEVTANLVAGLTDTNAAVVDSYTIPANDKKLTAADFTGVEYKLEVDFSNAGAGDYEANIVIELAVGL